MDARDFDAASDRNRAGTATRAAGSEWRESDPCAQNSRRWVSETIGLDSRIPGVPVESAAAPEQFLYEKVSLDPAPAAPFDCGAPARVDPRHAHAPAEPLQDRTVVWLTQLPERQRPLQLARLFPRIANRLCRLWADPPRCGGYLTSLLMDSRDGARKGFPMSVAGELAALLEVVDALVDDRSRGPLKGTQ